MGTDVIKSYDSLQQELDRAKHTLVSLNDNIRRIIGRDPKDTNLRGDRKRQLSDSRRNEASNDRSRNRDGSPPPAKRRNKDGKSVFSRLSGPPPIVPLSRDRDNEPMKPRIFSRVIRELPSREEIVTAQGPDAESRARNRRMFGSLLGTLHKFCQEDARLKKKEEQKAMVEKKVEEQEIKERANLKKERESLFMDRKRKQLEIKKLELKMNRLRDFESWEKSKKDLVHFIRTKTKPRIYFRPKVLNKKTEKLLAENRAAIEKEIEKKRAEFNEEVIEIENRFKMREDQQDVHPHNNGASHHPSKHDRQKSNNMKYDEDDDDDDDDDDSDEEDDDEENVHKVDSDHEREVSRIKGSSNHHEDLSSIQIKIQNDIKKEDIDPTELETDNSIERTLISSVVIPNKEIKRSID